jgi:heme-degrading monooxygenase HmoA
VVITLFRSRLRREARAEYERWAERMRELASAMPGFVSIKTFAADDGERISVVEFESEAAHGAWRDHPEHREAQRLGRERFYAEYQIQICTPVRRYGFSRDAGRSSED